MRKYLPYYSRFFFAPDGGDGSNGGAGSDGGQGGKNGAQGASGGQGGQSTEQIVAAVVAAIEARQQRAGDAVIKSMAEQYGMTADELKALAKAEQDKKKGQLSPEAQAQVDAANAKVQKMQLSAEVTKLGTAMGLVDQDVAMQLMDSKLIVYKDDGSIEGVQKALDALKESKPYLFRQEQKGGAWGQNRQGGAPDQGAGSLKDALRDYYKVK